MSSFFARGRVFVPAALGVTVFGALLGGCGAGQITQTDTQVAAVNGAMGETGQLALRDAQLAFPTGSQYFGRGATAPLIVTIANNGTRDAHLQSVSSPYFTRATIEGSKTVPAGAALLAGLDPDDHREPSSTPAQPGAGTPGQGTAKKAEPQAGKVKISLVGLTKDALRPGINTPVTFTFDTGAVTLQLPISSPFDHAPTQQ